MACDTLFLREILGKQSTPPVVDMVEELPRPTSIGDGLSGGQMRTGIYVLTGRGACVMLAAVWPSDNSVTERKNRAEDKIENK